MRDRRKLHIQFQHVSTRASGFARCAAFRIRRSVFTVLPWHSLAEPWPPCKKPTH